MFNQKEMEIARTKFTTKCKNARYYKTKKFLLNFEEYCGLIISANILPSDMGNSGDDYVLARKNENGEVDIGDYVIGNCRFIKCGENVRECNIGELNPMYGKQVSGRTKSKMSLSLTSRTRDEFSNEHKLKLSKSAKNRVRSVCPHCKIECTPQNLSRWHGDKCKKIARLNT